LSWVTAPEFKLFSHLSLLGAGNANMHHHAAWLSLKLHATGPSQCSESGKVMKGINRNQEIPK
jgi:hypothetical protein